MINHRFWQFCAATLLALSIFLSAAAASTGPERLAQARLAELERQQAIEQLGSVTDVVYGDHGRIYRISGDLNLQAPRAAELAGSADMVGALLRLPLGLKGDERLVRPRIHRNHNGFAVLRYEQEIDGIPVPHASLVISFRPDGRAADIRNDLLADEQLPRVPLVAEADAVDAAQNTTFPDMASKPGPPRLVYFYAPDRSGTLAWKMEVRLDERDTFPLSYQVYIDAISADVLAVRPLQLHAKDRKVWSSDHSMNYTQQGPLISDSSPSGPSYVQDVFSHSGTVYDFLASAFNLDSFNNQGITIKSTVRYRASGLCDLPCEGCNPSFSFCENDNIAFYDFSNDDNWFVYGDGDGVDWGRHDASLDTVAHEIMHAVTRHMTSGVMGHAESAAMNESFSDIFAASLDASLNGVSATTWRIGHDVYLPSDSTKAARYMNDPKLDANQWAQGESSSDDYQNMAGGPRAIYYNAGISNLAFYLLSQGGTHPRGVTSNNVPGVGIEKARSIFWRALHELPSSPTFKRLRREAVAAADFLYGSSEVNSVVQAFDAVRVPSGPDTPETLNAWSEMCHGFHSASWSASTGASTYELRASTTTNFTNGPTMYSGSATSASWFEIPHPDPVYLGVRACDGSDCSDFRTNGQQYTWFQGCM